MLPLPLETACDCRATRARVASDKLELDELDELDQPKEFKAEGNDDVADCSDIEKLLADDAGDDEDEDDDDETAGGLAATAAAGLAAEGGESSGCAHFMRPLASDICRLTISPFDSRQRANEVTCFSGHERRQPKPDSKKKTQERISKTELQK